MPLESAPGRAVALAVLIATTGIHVGPLIGPGVACATIPGMPAQLDDLADRLLRAKNMAHLAVPRRDGTIHAAVVWADVDDEGRIVVNSAEGRLWPKLLRNAGSATITVHNAENPYEYAGVLARLAVDSHDDADAVIDALAKKYLDADSYPFRVEGEQRITFRLEPERTWGYR